jgi:DNA replication protein DnaC
MAKSTATVREQKFLPVPNVTIGQWHERMGEPTLADAVLDRMVHNSYRIEMKGDSRRKQLAKEKKEKIKWAK